MDSNQQPGIYLEVKPVLISSGPTVASSVSKHHAYLVYRKADGSTEVIRGDFNLQGKISVETGKGLKARTVNERFARKATERGRRPLTGKEMDELQSRIARDDLDARKAAFEKNGHLGITGGAGFTPPNTARPIPLRTFHSPNRSRPNRRTQFAANTSIA